MLFRPVFSLILFHRRIIGTFFVLLLALLASPPLFAQSKVEVAKSGDKFQLMVNGKPFFIHGVGGTQKLAELRDMGGNSVRT